MSVPVPTAEDIASIQDLFSRATTAQREAITWAREQRNADPFIEPEDVIDTDEGYWHFVTVRAWESYVNQKYNQENPPARPAS